MSWLTDPYGGWQEQPDDEIIDKEAIEIVEQALLDAYLDEEDR